jgi:hypothetical protein
MVHAMGRVLVGVALQCLLMGVVASTAVATPRWLAPVALSAAGPNADTSRVVVDGRGDAFAVWEREGCCGRSVEAAERPAGGAWESPVDLSGESERGAAEPKIAVDASGDSVAVWSESGVIQGATRAAGGEWQSPTNLSEPGRAAGRPEVAVYPDGRALVVWQRSTQGVGVIQAASSSADGSWQPPVDLSEPGADSARIAVDAHGDALVVWNRLAAGARNIEAAALPYEGSWQRPVVLSAGGEGSEIPEIAMDVAGDAVAVWEHHADGEEVIQSAFRSAGGEWQPPVDVTKPAPDALEPHVGMDAHGDAIALWARSRGMADVIQAASRPAGGAWSTSHTLSETDASGERQQLAVNADGSAVAVWLRSGGNERVLADTEPAGGAWRIPVVLSEAGDDDYPAVAIDPQGNAVAVWGERLSGAPFAVQAAGFDDAGPLLGSLSIPASGTAGHPISFSVSPLDVWSALGGTTWKFGDGTSARGTSVVHSYRTPGTYTVTILSKDVLGNATSASGSITIAPSSGEAN